MPLYLFPWCELKGGQQLIWASFLKGGTEEEGVRDGEGTGPRKGRPGEDRGWQCLESRRSAPQKHTELGCSAGHAHARPLSPTSVAPVSNRRKVGQDD